MNTLSEFLLVVTLWCNGPSNKAMDVCRTQVMNCYGDTIKKIQTNLNLDITLNCVKAIKRGDL